MRIVCAVLLALGSLAGAQEDPDTDAARALFKRGMAQYDAGHVREAIAMFEQAKAIKPLPAFDYNIAHCHEQLGEWAQAIDAYEHYVASRPRDVAAVRAHVEELRRQHPTPAANEPTPTPTPTTSELPQTPLPTPAPPLPPRHRGRGLTIAGGVIGGVGVLTLVLGAVAGVDGDAQADKLTSADRNHVPFDPAVETRLNNDRVFEAGLLVVGAAATATGVVLIVLGQRVDGRAPKYARSDR